MVSADVDGATNTRNTIDPREATYPREAIDPRKSTVARSRQAQIHCGVRTNVYREHVQNSYRERPERRACRF